MPRAELARNTIAVAVLLALLAAVVFSGQRMQTAETRRCLTTGGKPLRGACPPPHQPLR